MIFSICFLVSSFSAIANNTASSSHITLDQTSESTFPTEQTSSNQPIVMGAEQFDVYAPFIRGKRVGLIVNQTSVVHDKHLVDFLLEKDINITTIFAPEHGFRGDHDAGAHVDSEIDTRTGIPIVSIYGQQKKPPAEKLTDIDVLIFDIQDVGVRFYTYISSMHYMMEAAAENNKHFIVLDRPNPNGFTVDGPTLDLKFQSFVGMHPIPLLHGMTVAELAQMINGEEWLANDVTVDLTVIPMQNYNRQMHYSLPIKPSPNLPNDVAVSLYPSLGFFEGTPISIGRGTDFPFQVIGYDKFGIGDFEFTPRSIPGAASNPKLKGSKLSGIDLRDSNVKGLNLDWLYQMHKIFEQNNEEFFVYSDFFDKLAGSDELRKQLGAGIAPLEIKNSWKREINKFSKDRRIHLLYP